MNTHSLRFRLTAWYAGLLAGALLVFGVSIYLGLERYLTSELERTLIERSRSVGMQLLVGLPAKGPKWLSKEITEDYAPEVNGYFLRIVRGDGSTVYISGTPKDSSFDPSRIPLPTERRRAEYSRQVATSGGYRLLIGGIVLTNSDGKQYWVESGLSDQRIEDVLHGLSETLAIYMPLIVSLAVVGGYWLMRKSLSPVADITRHAEGITSTNLSERLPVIKTGDELERLSISLNHMIAGLESAFQHIARFSADASHELRTPLTILQLELEGIVQHPRLAPELVDQIGSALEETHRLSRIVENLLIISRLDAGEACIEKVPLDLGELVSSTADQMRLLAEEKSVSLRCDVSQDVWIEGDKARLKQVIVNLTDNAIKYTPAGGQVTIAVRATEAGALLEVADTGVGISAEALPHVFERFYRTDKARSRDSGGAGLGLAIVKSICSAHNAEIRVLSTEGQGSRFIVQIANGAIGENEVMRPRILAAATSEKQ